MNSINSSYAIISDETTYVEPQFILDFVPSIMQAFFLTLTAELGDKTFIMLIILQLKTNQITIFFSALFAELLMNIIAASLGFAIKNMLYKNFIDYVGAVFFIMYGLWLMGNNFNESKQSFEKDLELPEKEEHKVKNEQVNENSLLDSGTKSILPIIPETVMEDSGDIEDGNPFHKKSLTLEKEKIEEEDEVDEDEQEKIKKHTINCKIFWVIVQKMALSECGDRTQFTAMTMAAVFNYYGVIIGSCIALFITIFLGVYIGKYLIKYLQEKVLNFILGIILLCYGIQIYLGKN